MAMATCTKEKRYAYINPCVVDVLPTVRFQKLRNPSEQIASEHSSEPLVTSPQTELPRYGYNCPEQCFDRGLAHAKQYNVRTTSIVVLLVVLMSFYRLAPVQTHRRSFQYMIST